MHAPLSLRASVLALLALLATTSADAADNIPDAGRTLQQLRPTPAFPSPTVPLVIQKPGTPTQAPGGPRTTLRGVSFQGNSKFSAATLGGVVGNVAGQSYDLAGLKALAERVTTYYHAHGYPFARAYIPAQPMPAGQLTIAVVEGRYGAIHITSTAPRSAAHAAAAQQFLGDLKTGGVIKSKPLERTTLILNDQPGYTFMPVIRPGQTVGTGDLDVTMTRGKRYGGSLSADDFGDSYTGRLRGLASVYANSPFLFGDRINLSGIYTQQNMVYGAADYSLPLGSSGLRAEAGYTQTYYQLGRAFADLDAHGTAGIASLGLTYPLVRTQAANLALSATYQHKHLVDHQDAVGTTGHKSSNEVPLAATFDLRDNLGGGGVTYGSFTYTHGALDLDRDLRATDAQTARTGGAFDKANLDVARLQATPLAPLTVFGRVAGQASFDNLDSSEDFGLGGPNGVRAYPTGEGYGDEGVLAQAELRYTVNQVTPYLFYDYGYMRTDHTPFAPNDNARYVGGGGVGTRASYHGFSADAFAAWRTNGGAPQSDTSDAIPQIWVTIGYAF